MNHNLLALLSFLSFLSSIVSPSPPPPSDHMVSWPVVVTGHISEAAEG